MSEPIADDETFLRLVGRHLAGDLMPAEREALATRLRIDPQARRRYRDLLAMDVLLHDQPREQLSPTARLDLRHVPRRTGRGRRRARATRRPPLALWVGLAAAAAVLVVVVLQTVPRRAPSSAGEGFAALLNGPVEVWRDGAPVTVTSLQAGDMVVASSAADVVFPDQSRVVLTSGSRLRLDADQGAAAGARVHLDHGTARCELRPQPRGFRLTTAQATVVVIGTRFTTIATPQTTAIALASGRVRIEAETEHTDLTAGDRAEVTSQGMMVTRAAPPVAPAAAALTGLAEFARVGQWMMRGPLPVEIGQGRLEVPPEPVAEDAGHVWQGRSWQWHQPLAATTTTAALTGMLHIPAGTGALDWQAELFCADADTTFDAEEGQPATCIRIAVRDRRASVQELVQGPDNGESRWQGAALLSEDSEVTLGLHLDAGRLSARLDGRTVWQGELTYERVLLGIRVSRRRSEATPAPVIWRTVTLTAP